MSLGLWITSGSGVAKLSDYRYMEGLSALYIYSTSAANPITVTRKYFACQSFRIEFYASYWKYVGTALQFEASEYGSFNVLPGTLSTPWEKRRVTFLWDRSTETKWFRLERWTGTEWVLVQADIGLGSIEPGNSTFSIRVVESSYNYTFFVDAMTCEVLA